MSARVLLVDGTFELYRAHFSPRPSRTDAAGNDIKAALGVLDSLRSLVREHLAEGAAVHLAVAFDNPIVCFRNDLFAGYKTDAGVPAELRAQFDLVEAGVRALGITVWSMNEFEADDAIATASRRFAAGGHDVRILSPDKDMGQCLGPVNVRQYDRIRKTDWGAEGVRAKLGVDPAQVPDYLALVGDTADGIPGLPGFGPKAAAGLLGAFGSLEQIPPAASAWPASVRGRDRLAAAFSAARDDVLLYRTLATLRFDVPLSEDLAALRVTEIDQHGYEAFVADARIA